MTKPTFILELTDINRQLQAVFKKVNDLQPVYREIGEYLLQVHNTRWRQQQSPTGIPWQPLSPEYRKSKPVNRDLILVLNDHLRQSLTYSHDENGLTFGTPLEYGAIHHYGGQDDMPPHLTAIPARPWLGVSEYDTLQIHKIITEHLKAD